MLVVNPLLGVLDLDDPKELELPEVAGVLDFDPDPHSPKNPPPEELEELALGVLDFELDDPHPLLELVLGLLKLEELPQPLDLEPELDDPQLLLEPELDRLELNPELDELRELDPPPKDDDFATARSSVPPMRNTMATITAMNRFDPVNIITLLLY